jgi:hypothetical protein
VDAAVYVPALRGTPDPMTHDYDRYQVSVLDPAHARAEQAADRLTGVSLVKAGGGPVRT